MKNLEDLMEQEIGSDLESTDKFFAYAEDAGRLIGWGLRPRETAISNPDYNDLMRQWEADNCFQQLTAWVAEGLGLRIADARTDFGLVLAPLPGSCFTPRGEQSSYLRAANEDRLVYGIVHLAIVATIFPKAADLEDVIARPAITVKEVLTVLEDTCVRLEKRFSATDSTEPPQTVSGDASTSNPMTVLKMAWQALRELPEARPTPTGMAGANTRQRYVQKSLDYLADEQGCFTRETSGKYRLTNRYQVLARECLTTELYQALSSLGQNTD